MCFNELLEIFSGTCHGCRSYLHFTVQFEISSSGHMRANNRGYASLVYANVSYTTARGTRTRRIKGGRPLPPSPPVKYWLHRFRPLLPRVKHGDIWRQIDQACSHVASLRERGGKKLWRGNTLQLGYVDPLDILHRLSSTRRQLLIRDYARLVTFIVICLGKLGIDSDELQWSAKHNIEIERERLIYRNKNF